MFIASEHLQSFLDEQFSRWSSMIAIYVGENRLPVGTLTPAGYNFDYTVTVQVRHHIPPVARRWRFAPESEKADVAIRVAAIIEDAQKAALVAMLA